jgi:hypothetical protein
MKYDYIINDIDAPKRLQGKTLRLAITRRGLESSIQLPDASDEEGKWLHTLLSHIADGINQLNGSRILQSINAEKN